MGTPYDSGDKNLYRTHRLAPYGPLSIASYVNFYSERGSRVEVLDLSVLNVDEARTLELISEMLDAKKYDIVGFSLLFNQTEIYLPFLCEAMKSQYPDMVIVAGGIVATNFYRELLERIPHLDAISYAEAEIPFLDLIDSEEMLLCLESHPSFITRDAIKSGRAISPTFVNDLDDLPLIDYSLVDLSYYGAMSLPPLEITESGNLLDSKDKELWIHTSRGCVYNCVYCTAHSVHGKKIRYMSAERTLEHINDMISRFGMTHLNIVDDQFLLNNKRAKKILRLLAEHDEKIVVFFNNLTVTLIDDEIAAYIKELRCPQVNVAIESGSQYVLDKVIKKHVNLDLAIGIVDTLKKHDLYVEAFFVIGLPGETDLHRKETLDFIKSTQIDWCRFFVATPFKGSELYEICEENDYFTRDPLAGDVAFSIISTPEYSAEYVTKQTYLMNLSANFINNNNYLRNRKDISHLEFKKVVQTIPDHAVCHYCLSRDYKEMNDNENFSYHLSRFQQITDSDDDWKYYCENLGISSKDLL
jgi:radical SAM superfamily enzyme YgiQ (UPF0313 family)